MVVHIQGTEYITAVFSFYISGPWNMISFLIVDTEALINKSNTDLKTKPTNTEQEFI